MIELRCLDNNNDLNDDDIIHNLKNKIIMLNDFIIINKNSNDYVCKVVHYDYLNDFSAEQLLKIEYRKF